MSEEMKAVLEGLTVLLGIVGAFFTMKTTLKRTVEDVNEIKKAQEKKVAADTAADLLKASTEGSAKTAFDDLKQKHGELGAETRNRLAALEGRATALERDTAEARVEMRNLTAGVARIEAKQDREAQQLDSLRRDVLLALPRQHPKTDPSEG